MSDLRSPELPQPKSPIRRNILKIGGGMIAGMVLREGGGRVVENHEKQSSLSADIKKINYEDLKNPENEKFKKFVAKCASEYLRLTNCKDVVSSDLIAKTKIYKSEEEFNNALRSAGHSQLVDSNQTGEGFTSYLTNNVYIDLQRVQEHSQSLTEYPGIEISNILFHEWGDLLPQLKGGNKIGNYLNNSSEVITDENNNDPQLWEKYQGGQIFSQNRAALYTFDNAWNETVSERLVMKSLDDDELKGSAAVLFGNLPYFSLVSSLSRVVQRSGITLEDMAKLHTNSQVEEMFKVIGQQFDDQALSEVAGLQRGNRSDAQMHTERDFLIGKRMAFLIDTKNQPAITKMYTYLRPKAA